MNILHKYGLDDFFLTQLQAENDVLNLVKIVSGSKKSFQAISEVGEITCLIKGSLIHHKITNDSLLPKVGDFVLLESKEALNPTNIYFINKILIRKNELKRKIVGRKNEMSNRHLEDQIIAVNMDFVFITLPCDSQFNIRRIERLVIACIDGNITPILVITKADLSTNIDEVSNQLRVSFKDIPIIITSFLDEKSVNLLTDMLKDNKIGVFIGTSGAGKSTLTNMILKNHIQKVNTVSDEKDKGKHTTTHRELFLLESGGCIIDNPGIKEFGLWLNDEESINYGFEDIAKLAKNCKFSDCTHTNEPNCAILKAVNEGTIKPEKLQGFLKLKQEKHKDIHVQGKHKKKEQGKAFNKLYKNAMLKKKLKLPD